MLLYSHLVTRLTATREINREHVNPTIIREKYLDADRFKNLHIQIGKKLVSYTSMYYNSNSATRIVKSIESVRDVIRVGGQTIFGLQKGETCYMHLISRKVMIKFINLISNTIRIPVYDSQSRGRISHLGRIFQQ